MTLERNTMRTPPMVKEMNERECLYYQTQKNKTLSSSLHNFRKITLKHATPKDDEDMPD